MTNERTTSQILEAYRRDGFFSLRGVFSPEDVDVWRAECRRLWQEVDAGAGQARVQFRDQEKGGTIADRIDPLLDVSPVFAELAWGAALTGIAAEVLGEPVEVFKAKLIMKRPGTMGYGMHQDYPYWEFVGIPADEFVNLVVALDGSSAENGAMELFPGRHHERIPADPKGHEHDTDESLLDLRSGIILDLAPGDMGVFHGYTPHRSGPNRSKRSRRNLYFTYIPARYGNDANERYYKGRKIPH